MVTMCAAVSIPQSGEPCRWGLAISHVFTVCHVWLCLAATLKVRWLGATDPLPRYPVHKLLDFPVHKLLDFYF